MNAENMSKILNNIVKLQKKHDCAGATDGAWFLFDVNMHEIVILGMTGQELYWEKAPNFLSDKGILARAREDADKPDNERCLACRVANNDLPWVISWLKTKNKMGITLEDFKRSGEGVTLTFADWSHNSTLDVPAIVDDDSRESVENMLYKCMVKKLPELWDKKYAPMQPGGHSFGVVASQMKTIMEIMPARNKNYEDPLIITTYGLLGKEELDGVPCRYITQNHMEILDAGVDDPERGIICMLVRREEQFSKFYLEG